MYHLVDLYSDLIDSPMPSDCGIACERLSPEFAVLNRKLTDSVSIFSYNLVTRGSATINYGGKTIRLQKNDLFIYTPGMMIKTLEVSDDYSGFCLMAEESSTYEIPYARNIVSASYHPALTKATSVLSLNDEQLANLEGRMEEIIDYSHSGHSYKTECLTMLFSLFIHDLLNMERGLSELTGNSNTHLIDLFLTFHRLMTENFKSHHDLEFYADKMNISSIYLSRIVKRISGQTVKSHIDRHLLMEASFLLRDRDYSISEIAEDLSFANQASFCKFFVRHKGLTPTDYRRL